MSDYSLKIIVCLVMAAAIVSIAHYCSMFFDLSNKKPTSKVIQFKEPKSCIEIYEFITRCLDIFQKIYHKKFAIWKINNSSDIFKWQIEDSSREKIFKIDPLIATAKHSSFTIHTSKLDFYKKDDFSKLVEIFEQEITKY